MDKLVATILISASLSSCAVPENYRFGDVTKTAVNVATTVVSSKEAYCEETNPEARNLLISKIRLVEPEYDGVCGDNNVDL